MKSKDPRTIIDPLEKKWKQRREFLEMLGEEFVKLAQARIRTKKADPDGNKWAPWSPATRKARRKKGNASLGLLFDTKTLYNSITYKVTTNKVSIQTDVPYAQFLQNGTTRMPARPFLGQGPAEDRATKRLFKQWLSD